MSKDHGKTRHHETPPLLEASVRIDNLPTAGREIEVHADDEQRQAIAGRMNVTTVEKLNAKLNAKRFRGGIRVLGKLDAAIEQPCVVTFVPVHQDIEEPIDRIFMPRQGLEYDTPQNAEILIDAEGEDDPDIFEGNDVDLSELILETLALAIDTYPRAPGANVDTTKLDSDPGEVSPFSVLKALRQTDGDE